MGNILSIVGIVVSTIALIVSVWLFDLSLDNGRKVLLHKIDYFITYDHEIFSIFSKLTISEDRLKPTVKGEIVEKYNKSMFELSRMLNDIKYSYFDIPLIPEGSELNDDGKTYKHKYYVKNAYEAIQMYFVKRNLPNFKIYLDYHDDRLYLVQHYSARIKYKRNYLIGPIIGYRIVYKRRNKFANYGQRRIKLMKVIKTEKDYKKYYYNCYLKFFDENEVIKHQPFEREVADFFNIANEQYITIYR
ncbi:MAG: hypothetical protein K2K38_04295 [Clostridia bacterium]|nr:hypothetical protein [Clostridia bacterium]